MKTRLFLVAAVLAACTSSATLTFGQAHNSNGNLPNNLFQQQYTPNGASLVSGGLYPAPHWVPGYVGGTYYTYQPLQPHEMMYQHSRNYYNFQQGPQTYYSDACQNNTNGIGAINVTKVRWQSGVNHMGPLPFTVHPFARLHYAAASSYYCAGGNCGLNGFGNYGANCGSPSVGLGHFNSGHLGHGHLGLHRAHPAYFGTTLGSSDCPTCNK